MLGMGTTLNRRGLAPGHKSKQRLCRGKVEKHGPVSACFTVYDDFLRYTGGVYNMTPGSAVMGGHCVRLLGWGIGDGADAGKPYWLVANEWSTKWGEGGFFRILRGANGAGFPSQTAAGIPAVTGAN